MTEKQKAICHKICDYYRTQHQVLKTIDKLSELRYALVSFVNNFGDIDTILDELADASIMIEEMMYCFDSHNIDLPKIIDTKLKQELEKMRLIESK